MGGGGKLRQRGRERRGTPRTFVAESDFAGPGPCSVQPSLLSEACVSWSAILNTSGHELGDLKNVCDPDTTWSHRPLTHLGELDSRSQLYSLPCRHGHQSQSPPPSLFQFPDSSGDCASAPGGCASGWPQAGPWSLAALHQKDPNFPGDLTGRDHDPHRASCLHLALPPAPQYPSPNLILRSLRI